MPAILAGSARPGIGARSGFLQPSMNPVELQLPELRQGLKLTSKPAGGGLLRCWTIHDPTRYRCFEISPAEFAILSHWRGGLAAAQVAERASAAQRMRISVAEVHALSTLLLRQELLSPHAPATGPCQPRSSGASRIASLMSLLRRCLVVRIPLLVPEPLLDRLLPLVRWTRARAMLIALGAAALLDLLILRERWTAFVPDPAELQTRDGILMMGLATFLVMSIMEFAHALEARRFGVRVPRAGIALALMLPLPYVDTSDRWRLVKRRERVALASARIVTGTAIAILATLLAGLITDGDMRSMALYLALAAAGLVLAIHANPFMRSDAYAIACELLELPNLRARSLALVRSILHSRIFGILDPDPEPGLGAARRSFMMGFAGLAWGLHLMMWLLVALLVFHELCRSFGLALMAGIAVWIVVRPVCIESIRICRRRAEIHPQWANILALAVLAGAALWGILSLRAIPAPAPAPITNLHARASEALRDAATIAHLIPAAGTIGCHQAIRDGWHPAQPWGRPGSGIAQKKADIHPRLPNTGRPSPWHPESHVAENRHTSDRLPRREAGLIFQPLHSAAYQHERQQIDDHTPGP